MSLHLPQNLSQRRHPLQIKLAVFTSFVAFVQDVHGGRVLLRTRNTTSGVVHPSLLSVGAGREHQPFAGPILNAFATAPQDFGPGTVFQGGPMVQAPPWFDSRGGGGDTAAGDLTGDCHPKCTWTCGHPTCFEVCEPICAPPQCETACAPINLALCMQKCDPPKCAVVCPAHHCETGDCPACKAICAPPMCKTECGESSCQSKCSDPQCTWKCKTDEKKCEEPKCSMSCGEAKMCNFNGDLNARPPPFAPGMYVLNRALAGLDPSKLIKPGGPEAPAGVGPGPGPAPAPAASPSPAAASPAPASASPAPGAPAPA